MSDLKIDPAAAKSFVDEINSPWATELGELHPSGSPSGHDPKQNRVQTGPRSAAPVFPNPTFGSGPRKR